jgi:hypothetical protein
MKINLSWFKNYQQGIVLALGYLVVALTAFISGKTYAGEMKSPPVRIEEVFSVPNNDSQNKTPAQSENSTILSGIFMPQDGDCQGRIKGNVASQDSRVYHVPGGSFYKRVAPELCFTDEAAAIAAGFRKSPK